jgi:hypothetical protein
MSHAQTHTLNEKARARAKHKKGDRVRVIKQHFCRLELMFDF